MAQDIDGPRMQDEEDEWEYEYDEDEKEDFYVTLDLSRITFPIIAQSEDKKRKHSQDSEAPVKEFNAEGARAPSNGNCEGDVDDVEEPPSTGPSAGAALTSEPAITPLPPAKKRPRAMRAKRYIEQERPRLRELQILDLAAREPILSVHGRDYRCEWASTVGTDLLLLPPTKHQGAGGPGARGPTGKTTTRLPPGVEPVHAAPGYSCVAATRLRLVARSVAVNRDMDDGGAATTAAAVGAGHPIPRADDDGAAYRASFAARFAAQKAARGDTDTLRDFVPRRRKRGEAKGGAKGKGKGKGTGQTEEAEAAREEG